MAFNIKERQVLGMHGLLPPHVMDIETQIARFKSNYDRQPSDLAKYKFLMDLADRNEILFYQGKSIILQALRFQYDDSTFV